MREGLSFPDQVRDPRQDLGDSGGSGMPWLLLGVFQGHPHHEEGPLSSLAKAESWIQMSAGQPRRFLTVTFCHKVWAVGIVQGWPVLFTGTCRGTGWCGAALQRLWNLTACSMSEGGFENPCQLTNYICPMNNISQITSFSDHHSL